MSRSVTPGDLTSLCERCWQRRGACLCADVPRVVAKTEVIILRHAKERWRTSNTTRLVELAVAGVEMIEVGARGDDREAFEARVRNILARPGHTRLLFPGGEAPALNGSDIPRRIIVPDGSWQQARRMVMRVPGLSTLPKLSLAGPERPRRRLRLPTRADGVSTIEAIAQALDHLEGKGSGAALETLYDLMVERSLPHRRRMAQEQARSLSRERRLTRQ